MENTSKRALKAVKQNYAASLELSKCSALEGEGLATNFRTGILIYHLLSSLPKMSKQWSEPWTGLYCQGFEVIDHIDGSQQRVGASLKTAGGSFQAVMT